MKIGIVVEEYEDMPHETYKINARVLKRELEKLGEEVYIIYFKSKSEKKDERILHFSEINSHKLDAFYLSGKISNFHFSKLVLLSIIKRIKIHFRVPSYNLKLFKKYRFLFKILIRVGVIKLYSFDRTHQEYIKNHLRIKTEILEPCVNIKPLKKVFKDGIKSYKPLEKVSKKGRFKSTTDILFIGSDDDLKRGLVELLKAVKIIKQKKSKIKLIITSKHNFYNKGNEEGKWARDLVKDLGIEKNVVFKGKVKDIGEEYKKARVYVLPVKIFKQMPPIPYSILEALYYKIPVIATNHWGMASILDKKFLLDKNLDEKEIAEKILWVLETKPKVFLDEKFLPENSAKKFLNYLR